MCFKFHDFTLVVEVLVVRFHHLPGCSHGFEGLGEVVVPPQFGSAAHASCQNSHLCCAFHAEIDEFHCFVEFIWGCMSLIFIEYLLDCGLECGVIFMKHLFKSFNEVFFIGIFPIVLSFRQVVHHFSGVPEHECECMVV